MVDGFLFATQEFDGCGCGIGFVCDGFVGEENTACADQRKTVLGEDGEGGYGARDHHVKGLSHTAFAGVFGTQMDRGKIIKTKVFLNYVKESDSFIEAVDEGNVDVVPIYFEGDGGKTGTRAHVGDFGALRNELRAQKAVDEVLYYDFVAVGNGGQIELLIVFIEQVGETLELVDLFVREGKTGS